MSDPTGEHPPAPAARVPMAHPTPPGDLIVVDAWVAYTPSRDEVLAAATSAVVEAGAIVVDSAVVEFSNGATTVVLVLAESHLAVHTWPENGLVLVDFFSCGRMNAGAVIDALASNLSFIHMRRHTIGRGADGPGAPID